MATLLVHEYRSKKAPTMTLEDMKAAAKDMKDHIDKANALAYELWEAGCHVESFLAPIQQGIMFEQRSSPKAVTISVFLPV